MLQIKKVYITILISTLLTINTVKADNKDSYQLSLNIDNASHFAKMALSCISREYPNNPSHLINNEKEIWSPKFMHPAFYGCFDWHSAVHGHWMLIRLLKNFPELPEAKKIRESLDHNLTRKNILQEVQYFQQKSRKSFERTYGWAWFLKLIEELEGWEDVQGKSWQKNLKPLEEEIIKQYHEFFPKQTYPIRTGVHPNTAFGLAFALDYARKLKNSKLETLIIERAISYFLKDQNYPASWEPSGEDFFSPCLMEADLMRRILSKEEFNPWFDNFLPDLLNGEPRILLEPAMVTDRSDGKLVHLDGLNLSRAWCMKNIAASLPESSQVRKVLIDSAIKHARDGIKNISSGDYAGEHWMASFAIFLLTE